MKYLFSYYKEEDFYPIEELILLSYQWEYPVWGLSRHEFSKGLHPAFTGHYHAWLHTVGVYRDSDKIVACVINEGHYSGEVFFLFDNQSRANDRELLYEMIRFAKTHNSKVEERNRRILNIFVPHWNILLREILENDNFIIGDWSDDLYILDFPKNKFEVKLPDGYTLVEGSSIPDFYLSNTHRYSFGYGGDNHACEHGREAFHNLRKMKHYNQKLDLCILDKQRRPIAMALIWYDEKMPYCELEPLGVVWWERRRGIATALLHEAANRVMDLYPNCCGMTGGDQQFYKSLGFIKKRSELVFQWEITVHPSWDTKSKDIRYHDMV